MSSAHTVWGYAGAEGQAVPASGIVRCGEAKPVCIDRPIQKSLSDAWLMLAVGSLILSGLFAIMLVIGRLPPFTNWISDPGFFRRCLVAHVNLSLLIWLGSFMTALFARSHGRRLPSIGSLCFAAACVGVVAMATAVFLPNSQPVLSNYIPFIDNRIFGLGIALFITGVIGYFLTGLLVFGRQNPEACKGVLDWGAAEAIAGIRTAGLAYVLAGVTFIATLAAVDPTVSTEGYYELLAWGGGHVLQVANVAAMMTLWLLCARAITGRAVFSARTAWILFALLLAPHLSAPLLTLGGTADGLYLRGFTRLMQFGIFPVVLVVTAWIIIAVIRAGKRRGLAPGFSTDPRFIALTLSILMTLTGFVLGALIRGSTTMIPAHYHASIGAVTVMFMAGAYFLAMERHDGTQVGLRLRWKRWLPLQLGMFGGGQLVFALGFAIGGTHGLGRKEYGAEQVLYSIGEYIGIGMMGLGGLVAAVGGITFLVLFTRIFFSGRSGPAQSMQTGESN